MQFSKTDLAILQLLKKEKVALNTFITKQIRTKLNVSRYAVYRSLKKLQSHGLVKRRQLSKKLSEYVMLTQGAHIDLNNRTPARNNSNNNVNNRTIKNKNFTKTTIKTAFLPRWHRMNSFHAEAVKKFANHRTLSALEQQELNALFHAYVNDITQRLILLRDINNNYHIADYKSRFTSMSKAVEIMKKFENAFEIAKNMYDKGVFLTITLPPVFPQRVALWFLSFALHRIKAYARRRYKTKIEHVKVPEPQSSFYPHFHILLFGLDYLVDKYKLTQMLENYLTRFLQNLGNHYRKTINKRADELTVQVLNDYGSLLLKKYNKYKRQHPKYAGPVNHITKLTLRDDKFEFEHPPPDRKKRTMKDGGAVSAFDYVKVYVAKNIKMVKEIKEALQKDKTIKKEKDATLAWYWFHRLPFFTLSKSLRTVLPTPPPQGLQFVKSIYIHELSDYAHLLA